ncbi:MAG: hypothetical protein R3C14_02045 [Caldilineaceae bacterium]
MTETTQRAGYSQRPLAAKLGIKAHDRCAVLQTPSNYRDLIAPLPEPLFLVTALVQNLNFVHFFTTARAELMAQFPHLKAAILKDGMIWISWPKRSAKAVTDLDETVVRTIGLEQGLVDVKVAAIDHFWSGLKFVYRKADR